MSNKSKGTASESRVAILKSQKEALENEIEAKEKELEKLDDLIDDALAQVERESRNRHVFPDGFHFSYNNRRGDPQYTCYWVCVLRSASGVEVWRAQYSEDHYTEESAKATALDAAWKLYDIAQAIKGQV